MNEMHREIKIQTRVFKCIRTASGSGSFTIDHKE